MHIAATSQSLILAGESTEVDNLAKRATLIKGQQGGPLVLAGESAADGSSLSAGGDTPGPIIDYELWVSSGSNTFKTSRSPLELYKRTFQNASLSRPKILDVFA